MTDLGGGEGACHVMFSRRLGIYDMDRSDNYYWTIYNIFYFIYTYAYWNWHVMFSRRKYTAWVNWNIFLFYFILFTLLHIETGTAWISWTIFIRLTNYVFICMLIYLFHTSAYWKWCYFLFYLYIFFLTDLECSMRVSWTTYIGLIYFIWFYFI